MAETMANLAKEGLEKYSTTEQVIGTWIDGKPIYRIVRTGTVFSVTEDLFVLNNAIDVLISLTGCAKLSNGYMFPFNYAQGTTNYFACFVKPDKKTITYRAQNYEATTTYTVVIEYTKQ